MLADHAFHTANDRPGSVVNDRNFHQPNLVSCPRNTRYFAGGQLAVFQGGPSRTGGKAPISESYGSSEQRGKTANWPRPKGCDENGPAAALLVGHVSIQVCSLLPPVRIGPPCRRPLFVAKKYLGFRWQDTS